MKFTKYLKDNINYILWFMIFNLIIGWYLKAIQLDMMNIFIIFFLSSIFFISLLLSSYFTKNKYIKNIEMVQENLPEKYLICEVIKKPRKEENLSFYRILKRANKSMIEKVSNIKQIQKEYKEYIESWVHEIKIPITSAKLLCENNKSEITAKLNDEIEEINNYVEQVLFYARLDQVSNDYMIRKINLELPIRNVLSRNKKIMIQNNMKVEIGHINCFAYTDEKWLEFILNQIVNNSIKYKKNDTGIIFMTILEEKDNVKLLIKDNGIGIKKSEIDRIFEKGFTGSNGRNHKKSTGIGLYLCKRLCLELGMDIVVKSKENEFTEMMIIIPKCEKIS